MRHPGIPGLRHPGRARGRLPGGDLWGVARGHRVRPPARLRGEAPRGGRAGGRGRRRPCPPGHGAGEPSAGRRPGGVQRGVRERAEGGRADVLREGGRGGAHGRGGGGRPGHGGSAGHRRPAWSDLPLGAETGGPADGADGVPVLPPPGRGRPPRRAGPGGGGVREAQRLDPVGVAGGPGGGGAARADHPPGHRGGPPAHGGGPAIPRRGGGGPQPHAGRGGGIVARLWRGVIEEYRDRLPVTGDTPVVTLLEGGTPLLPSERLSEETGCLVYLKYEGANPTGSFKDRGMTVAVSRAIERGAKAVVCASTGNTSASAAAYAARAGLACAVMVPKRGVAAGKLAQALVAGARVLEINGNF